jgi:DNA-binding transcriptional LysR family regulator
LVRRVVGDGDEALLGELPRIGTGGLFLHTAARVRHDDRRIFSAFIETLGKVDDRSHGDRLVVRVNEIDLADFPSPSVKISARPSRRRLSDRTRISRQRLIEHRCTNLRLPTSGALNGWRLLQNGREIRVQVDGPLIFNTIDLILDAALGGLGLAYLPLDQVDHHIADGQLKRVLDKWTPPLPGYHLYYPSQHLNSPAFKLVVDTLRYRLLSRNRVRKSGS